MKTFIMACFVLAFSGCNFKSDYKLITSQNGRVYRIDKSSGEVSLVEGFTITKLQEPKTEEESKQEELKLFKAITWPTIKLPGTTITLVLRTIWREGNIYYQLNASPYEGDLQRSAESYLSSSSYFSIEMRDKDGFILLRVPISISRMSGIVDNNGKRESMEANDKIECTSGKYLSFVGWNSGYFLK